MTSLPARMSSIACSIVPNGILWLQAPEAGAVRLQPLTHVLANQVSLQMYPAAGHGSTQGRRAEGMGDQRDLHIAASRQGIHRETHAVHRDGPVGDAHRPHLRGNLDVEEYRVDLLFPAPDRA